MNTVTTSDLRNQFRRISAWLENGEAVEIVKRGKPYARLLPVIREAAPAPVRVDFAAQRREIWRGRKFSPQEVEEMRASEREGEE